MRFHYLLFLACCRAVFVPPLPGIALADQPQREPGACESGGIPAARPDIAVGDGASWRKDAN